MIDVIGKRYKILFLIGQGGMADVYLAQDLILSREVAIKILRQSLANDPMTIVRFQREASAASKLSHPNVVDIYDVGEADGYHYIVMEYIRGRTLKQLINQRGALDYHEAISIMKQLTSAIAKAHANHIIHRDIKPQNVLVKDDGTAKLTDFGIAIANDAVQLTYYNTVMGSAHYLAPETAQGKEPNEQIDIYSLGIVFYELLTGDVPFRGNTPTEIAIKHLREPLPYPRLFNPQIPQSVENIVIKASAKDVKERYEDAREMLYDLEHCLEAEYLNMPRIQLKHPTIDIIEIKDGAIRTNPIQKEVKPVDPKPNPHSLLLWGAGIVSSCLILCMILLVSGIVRFKGFLGYEEMPDLMHMQKEQAILALQNAHSQTDHIEWKEVVQDDIPAGEIYKTSIKPGSIVKDDAPLIVEISKGPSFMIQDYTGLYLEDVQRDLQQQGVELNMEIEYKGEPNTYPGVILEQSGLEPGDKIDPSAYETIRFVVSEYPTIIIPDTLIGMDVYEAKEYLNGEGIAVNLRKTSSSSSNKVISVTPKPGSSYTQEGTDSVVTLYY